MRLRTLVVPAILLVAAPAQATTILGSSFTDGTGTHVGSGVTFTAEVDGAGIGDGIAGDSGAVFRKKTIAGFTGVGIDTSIACPAGTIGCDRTADEIDAGFSGPYEVLRGAFGQSSVIDSFRLSVLYDGPEFDDVEEVARVQVAPGIFGILTTDYTAAGTLAHWSVASLGISFDAVSVSPALGSAGAVWLVSDPFGSGAYDYVSFSGLPGTCGSGPCTNPSDFAFERMTFTPVPEPSSLLALGLGLLGLGEVARRRRSRR